MFVNSSALCHNCIGVPETCSRYYWTQPLGSIGMFGYSNDMHHQCGKFFLPFGSKQTML